MPDLVEPRLAVLPTLSKAALGDLWKQFFGSTSPAQLRRDLMIPILAYRIRSRHSDRSVPGPSNDFSISVAPSKKEGVPSSLALRTCAPEHDWFAKWGDRVHLVNVETNGYEYHGARYQSLSEIARLITGTRWSGPLFFGIKRESAKRPSQNWKALLQADWHGARARGEAVPQSADELRGWWEYAANVRPVQGITTSGKPPRH